LIAIGVRAVEQGLQLGGDVGVHAADRTQGVPLETSIHTAAMGGPQCQNNEFGVLDRVDDAVVADANPPEIWLPDER